MLGEGITQLLDDDFTSLLIQNPAHKTVLHTEAWKKSFGERSRHPLELRRAVYKASLNWYANANRLDDFNVPEILSTCEDLDENLVSEYFWLRRRPILLLVYSQLNEKVNIGNRDQRSIFEHRDIVRVIAEFM